MEKSKKEVSDEIRAKIVELNQLIKQAQKIGLKTSIYQPRGLFTTHEDLHVVSTITETITH